MNTPATTIFSEACAMISAQIDALDSPEEMTPEQLLEFQGRSELIRLLCEQLVADGTLLEEQLLQTTELLEGAA